MLALVDKANRSVTTLTQGFGPLWSPDSRWIAYNFYPGNSDGTYIRLIDVQTKRIIDVTYLKQGNPSTIPAWLSPTELAFFNDKPLVFDLRSQQARQFLDVNIWSNKPEFPPRFFISAPSKNIFATDVGGEILLFEWINGTARLIRRIQDGLDNSYWALSADGQFLAYVSNHSRQVNIVGVYDTNFHVILPSSGKGSPSVENWSPDSASLFYGDFDGMKIVNRDGSGLQLISRDLTFIKWSPSGNEVITMGPERILLFMPVTRQP